VKHVTSINQKAERIEAYLTHESAMAAAQERDVVGLRTPPHEQNGPHFPLGCSLVFSPGWEVDSQGGTAGLCQPVERDIFDCHLSCFWPAHVPDQLITRPTGRDSAHRRRRTGASSTSSSPEGIPAMPTLTRLVVCLAALAPAAATASAQTATWYIGTYTNDILVWDEASEQVVDRIRVANAIPSDMTLNETRNRLYVRDATAQHMEVVDLGVRRVVDSFTLSHDNVSVRLDSFVPNPAGDRAVIVAKRYTKLRDRYTVEGPFILEYDLRQKQVTDTLQWPDGRERDRGGGFRYSPDGETLYFFGDDVIALDADTYQEMDRWELSQPLEPGLGRPSFGLNPGTYDAPGVATSLLRLTDPAQNRSMLGVATVRLSEMEVDFFTLGTSAPMRAFTVAPGGTKAYGLYSEVGRYEFWEFDLEARRVTRREPFAGRPRMGLQVSADGQSLYIHVAGNTIDVYDVDTFELVRTVEFAEDMTDVVVVPGGVAP